MNRDRFKFRVWAKIGDQYYPTSVFCVSDLAAPDDSIVVEQCTGLKDRDGKLIYEGDIVSFQSRGLFFKGTVVWTQEEAPGEINLGGFGIRLPEDHEYEFMDYSRDRDSLEVVGNVHEDGDSK